MESGLPSPYIYNIKLFIMKNSNFKIGQVINYTNGQPCIYTGVIVQITETELIVIGNEAGMILWNLGYAVGSCIKPSQVVD